MVPSMKDYRLEEQVEKINYKAMRIGCEDRIWTFMIYE